MRPVADPTAVPPDFDFEAFARDLHELRAEIDAALGPDDLAHLKKLERWGRLATTVGWATSWLGPNPVSILGLAWGRGTRWILMHHIGHRGYDRVPEVPPRYTSKVFARGRRRFLDWADWMLPDAWIYEHNVLHHSHTGQDADPDLVERNVAWLRKLPRPARWAFFAISAAAWKPAYYAPNTLDEYLHRGGAKPSRSEHWRTLITQCWLPYGAASFVLVPLLFSPLGPLAVASAVTNSVAAEVATNIHSFCVIVPNHAGDDVYRFSDRPRNKADHLLRQVLGSVNFRVSSESGGLFGSRYGKDLLDMAHLWLNYQVEHHVFPDLPMLKYQQFQPAFRAICERHGVPYVQGSVWERVGKLARNFVGDTEMKRYQPTASGRAQAAE